MKRRRPRHCLLPPKCPAVRPCPRPPRCRPQPPCPRPAQCRAAKTRPICCTTTPTVPVGWTSSIVDPPRSTARECQ
ncbi:MAG: hypothetical protein DLM50_01095 [Candidatus Meridianibacter frigidus]|nr:MAG: hypothetical protein DLM50_01095 [Candidatus Eremiobacteraeota bacterium]